MKTIVGVKRDPEITVPYQLLRCGDVLSRSTKSLGHGWFARLNIRSHLEFKNGERAWASSTY